MRFLTKTTLAVALLSTNAFANINANNGFYVGCIHTSKCFQSNLSRYTT